MIKLLLPLKALSTLGAKTVGPMLLGRAATARRMDTAHRPLPDKLARLAGKKFPIYMIDRHTPSVVPHVSRHRHKVVVHSVPKSGTYLMAKLLDTVGYVDTELHIGLKQLSDYRGKSLQDKVEEYFQFTMKVPARDIAELMLNGQFVVGHLPCNREITTAFSDFKQVFMYREIRDSLVSYMRFLVRRGNTTANPWITIEDGRLRFEQYMEKRAAAFIREARLMVGWLSQPGVFAVRFESLCGDDGQECRMSELRRLIDYLGLADKVEVNDQLITSVFGAQTMTWSGKRTCWKDYWSDRAEERFRKLGCDQLNRQLGFVEV